MSVNAEDLIKVTARQAKDLIIKHLAAGIVPLLRSSPGMGKSSMLREVAKEAGLFYLDHRLSTSIPEDLNGLPDFVTVGDRRVATFTPFDIFPTKDTPIPKGYNGFLLNLDEFTSMKKEVQAAAYKLVLDRMVGQNELHPDCFIVCAGNLDTDRAITNPLSTAMASRLAHLELVLNPAEFVADVAIPQGWDHRVIGFLSAFPSKLHVFNPSTVKNTFTCPRTWDMAQRLAKSEPVIDTRLTPLFTSVMGTGEAVDFVAFCSHFQSLPGLDQIMADPTNLPLPQDRSKQFAILCLLLEHVSVKNFEKLNSFVSRFPAEMQVMFFRHIRARVPALHQHPDYRKAIVTFAREMFSE